jgi:RNA polymerase-interacting CarD/CdnL/TRCF family regulator
MSAGLAAATRQQLDGVKALFAGMGAVKSVTFKSVEQSGADVYVVEFEHGSTEWRIILAPDGKIDMLGFRPI